MPPRLEDTVWVTRLEFYTCVDPRDLVVRFEPSGISVSEFVRVRFCVAPLHYRSNCIFPTLDNIDTERADRACGGFVI